MKFRCELDPEYHRWYLGPDDYTAQTPEEAARLFAKEREERGDIKNHYVVVTPIDDEARALPGWKIAQDDDYRHAVLEGDPYRLFVVAPKVSWKAHEVDAFASVFVPPPQESNGGKGT